MPRSAAKIHKRMILRRLRAGEYLTQIAPDAGITRQAISLALTRNKAYQRARKLGAIRRFSLTHGRARQWVKMRYLSDWGPDDFSRQMGFSPRLSPAEQVLNQVGKSGHKKRVSNPSGGNSRGNR